MNNENFIVNLLYRWKNLRFEIKSRIYLSLFFILVVLAYLFWPKQWPSMGEITVKPMAFVPFILLAFQEILYSLIFTPIICYGLTHIMTAKNITTTYSILSLFIFFYLAFKLNSGFEKGGTVISLYPYEILFSSFFTAIIYPILASVCIFYMKAFGLINKYRG